VAANQRDQRRAAIGRTLGWTLVAGLTIAAITASFAILSGDFDDTDWR
jgi:hypothetical protein